MKKDDLVRAFKALGAKDPEVWASHQIENNTPELERYAFVKKCWDYVAGYGENKYEWIEEALNTPPGNPGHEVVSAINEMVEKGVSKDAMCGLVRFMQWKLLSLIYIALDDPTFCNLPIELNWGLFALDANDRPKASMNSLIESLLVLEPSGTELGARPISESES